MKLALSILGLFVVSALVIGIVLADDGMAACLTLHSFDVCHDAIY